MSCPVPTARLAIVTLATIVSGCGRVGFDEGADAPAACSSWGSFSAPTRLTGPFRTAADEWFPTPSSDELELYFYAVVGGSTFDIVRSTRATRLDQFSAATAIGGVNSPSTEDKAPTLTADGLVMVYTRAEASYDLREATRNTSAEAFGPGTSLTILNTNDLNEVSPWLSPDGLRLLYVCDSAICETSRSNRASGWVTPVVHTELQHGGFQDTPTTSADGLDVWYAEGPIGGLDIYTAHRPTLQAPFGAPTPVGALDSARDDLGLRLSLDGATMYLNYDTLFTGNGNADLWVATRSCQSQ